MKIKIKILSFFLLLITGISAQNKSFDRTLTLMGSRFDITVVAEDKNKADRYIDLAISEIERIESLISSWDPNSQTSQINRNAGVKPIVVDQELFELIERAIKISKLTNGAFDISYASMDKIWFFDGSMTRMPSKESIKESISKVGYQNILLNKEEHSVFLKLKGMKIGFGAIGKGYAADKTKAILQENGVTAGIINASGDLNAWGTKPNGDNWMVAIVNPLNKNKIFSWFPIVNSTVVTSGNYEKYVTFDGQLYSHIIDPRTGYPSKGTLSASVMTKNAELADALATSIFVMGVESGLNLINQLNGVECVIIDENSKVHTSNSITIKHTE